MDYGNSYFTCAGKALQLIDQVCHLRSVPGADPIFSPKYFLELGVVFQRVHSKLSQLQVVCEDTNHGPASVGVLTDRNQERQFGMHPISTLDGKKLRYICMKQPFILMDAENENLLTEQKPMHQTASSSLLRTILSLGLFIGVDYWIFKDWSAVFLLVSVIVLHESGHFIAMKIYGYKGINMTFIPFMGAYVSGESTHFSRYKKIIMLLSGPLPGIVIGMALLFLYHQNLNEYFYLAALAFLLLNVFNLLPVSPLDGGQLIETLFSCSSQVIQIVFLAFSLLILFYLLYAFQAWYIIIILWFIFMRTRSLLLVYKVRKELDRKKLAYDYSYDELTDEQYAEIRDVLISRSNSLRRIFSPGEHSEREGELIRYIERILVQSYDHNLTRLQRGIFITIYLLSFILPVFQWGYLKGWF